MHADLLAAWKTWRRACAQPRSFLLLCVLVSLGATNGATAQSAVVGWGESVFNSAWNDEHFVEVEVGWNHTVARRSDGSVVAFGYNQDGQCNVPALPAGLSYTALAAGLAHAVALRSDGALIAWVHFHF